MREMGLQMARIASSKTVLRPFWVRAEHSRYLTAPMDLAIWIPWGYWIGDRRLDMDERYVFEGDVGGVNLPVTELSYRCGILTQIKLGADEDDGGRRGVMADLGVPLCHINTSTSLPDTKKKSRK